MKTYLPMNWLGRCAGCVLLLSIPPLHAEVTPVQTVQFGFHDDGTFTDADGSDIDLSVGENLSTFDQFDPALGTLTEVLVTATVTATIRVTLSSDAVTEGSPSFDLSLDGTGFAQTSVVYSPTGGNFGKALTFDVGDIPSTGDSGLIPSHYGAPDEFSYVSETGEEIYGNFANDGTATTGSLLASYEGFNPPDWIGTGTVQGLSIFHYVTISGAGLTIANLDQAFIEAEISLAAGEVTLQYVYTPAVTSVPTMVTGYQKNGSTHTITFTGQPGATAWAIKGGNDLVSFGTDHTADAVITETTPGNYQAVLSLPALVEPRYFFRIE